MQALYETEPSLLVWWATEVEAASAIARLERDGTLTPPGVRTAFERLGELNATWSEIQPVEAVRRIARRLVRVHPLRAADSLQLAAALVACEGDPASLTLVSLDHRLAEAGEREGLVIVGS